MNSNLRIFLLLATLGWMSSCTSGPKEAKTPSGFRYFHHVKTEGAKPQAGEYAIFQVTMLAEDSVVFESRGQGPAPKVIMPGAEQLATGNPSPVTEALALMSVGDSLSVYYPLDSMGRRPPGFENVNEIQYNLVLTEIKTKDEVDAEAEALRQSAQVRIDEISASVNELIDEYKNGQLGDQLKTTSTGLSYVILEEGSGPNPEQGQTVFANYYGALLDGASFDNSYARGRPLSFPLGSGQVIQGWDEGFALLNKGSKAVFFVPSELGYGASGFPPEIPGNAELVFYVELEDIR